MKATYAWMSVAILAGVIALVVFVVRFWPFTVDDAFITFRYSAHLARGMGPTWNGEGDRVEGYTTFLWMLLMAVPHALRLTPLVCAKALGVLFTLGHVAASSLLAFYLTSSEVTSSEVTSSEVTSSPTWSTRLARSDRASLSAVTAILLGCFSPPTAVHAVSGMETSLFTLLVTVYFLLLARLRTANTPRASRWAAAIGALAGFTRPEGNLVVMVATGTFLLLERSARARRTFLRSVLVLHVVPGAAYFAWRAWYYGQWFPLSFYVKTTTAGFLAGGGEVLDFLRDVTVERLYVGVPFLIGAASSWPNTLPALAGSAALLVFFAFPAHIMAFDRRYLFPVIPFFWAVTGAGVGRLWEFVDERRGPSDARTLPSGFAYASVLLFAFAGQVPGAEISIREKVDYGRGLERAHVELARDLASLREQVDRPLVALVDAGAIPYFSGWQAVDTFGLNEAHIARTGSHDPGYVLDQSPEALVLISSSETSFVAPLLWEQAFFDEARKRGFGRVRTYEFAPDYFLWLLAKPESAVARELGPKKPEERATQRIPGAS